MLSLEGCSLPESRVLRVLLQQLTLAHAGRLLRITFSQQDKTAWALTLHCFSGSYFTTCPLKVALLGLLFSAVGGTASSSRVKLLALQADTARLVVHGGLQLHSGAAKLPCQGLVQVAQL